MTAQHESSSEENGAAVEVAEETAAAAPANPIRRIVLIVLGLLLAFYVYGVISDRVTPYTSQATVDTLLTQIAPEVTGQVMSVGVADNRTVEKGQVLFQLDRRPFEIALRSARANLASALQSAGASSTEIDVAQATLQRQRVDLAATRQLGRIVIDLAAEGAVPQTSAIRARAEIAKTQADVVRSVAEVERARQRLGESGLSNATVRQALAAVEQAELNLSNTTVVAPERGVVTNLRLSAGQFVNTGQPLLSFIETGPRWVSAAMRENQLGNIAPGNRVLVVLDHSPGRVFVGRVESIGWGVTQGGEAPTGQLPSVEPDSGWVREPQRFPVRIRLIPTDEGDALAIGRSGAQANVMVFTDPESAILNPLGRIWIRVVSWLSYLQ